jgi:hypothetical protein
MLRSVTFNATTRKSRPIRASLIVGTLLALVLPGSVLGAGQPIVVHRDIDVTVQLPLLTNACGYPVFSRFEGTVTIVVQYDSAGRPDTEVDSGVVQRTLFAPSTGGSLSWPTHLNSFADYEPDGSGISSVTGLATNAHSPGGAPLLFDGGREVWTVQIAFIDDEGVPIVDFIDLLSKSGNSQGAIQDICAGLDA